MDNTNSGGNIAGIEIIKLQDQAGFPIKKSFAIGFVVLWNMLFFSDILPFFLQSKKEGIPAGVGTKSAIGLLFITSIFIVVSAGFRRLILKEGRELRDVKKFVYFVIFISGIMLISFMKLWLNT